VYITVAAFQQRGSSCLIHRVKFLTLGEKQEKGEGKITAFLPQMQICTSLLLSSLECLCTQKPRWKPVAAIWLANHHPYYPKNMAKTW